MPLSRKDAFRFVWLIGLVSLFSDMTYQGAHGNAGPYLALLGASGTAVGIVAGGGELVNYTLRLFSGYWADRTNAYWRIAFPGYLLNLLVVPCLAFTSHWWTAALLLILERTGKGLRTPPRDVMLSHAADQVGRGWAFGIHEALDQTGGMLGPLLVAGMLFGKKGYHASFAVLAIPASLALLLLTIACWLFPHPEQHKIPLPLGETIGPMHHWTDGSASMQSKGGGGRGEGIQGSSQEVPPLSPSPEGRGMPFSFWLLVAGVGCLAIGFADFALMAFHFKKEAILSPAWIPVCYGMAMGLQGLASLGFGALFDRWGTRALLVGSIPAIAFAPLAFSHGMATAVAGLGLWALGLGAQGSIMKALVAQLIPAERRGSAYGILNSAYGVLWFIGSALMGWLYDHSLHGLILFSIAAQIIALPFLLSLCRKQK